MTGLRIIGDGSGVLQGSKRERMMADGRRRLCSGSRSAMEEILEGQGHDGVTKLTDSLEETGCRQR